MKLRSNNKQKYAESPLVRISDHGEKPSQRVPSPFLVILLGFYMLLPFLTILIEDELPKPIKEGDITVNDSNTFSEESARKYLNKILGNMPRVSGTMYHLVKTRDLKQLVDEIGNHSNVPIHTDWQYVEGDYWLAFSSPHVNVYRHLSNVIAVLEGESGFNPDHTSGSSILVNCHYDSVPFAIGASDNGVFCGVMAEILSKLSRRKTKLKHNIIFLFNGAEENVLLGSHGFLSHRWSKGVISVINLDSAGMNGRPSVFQVTDPRVLEKYRKTCTRPTAQGMGEFLFSTGIIPSDTDFRIWRDFGNFTGVDIAFAKGGHVYHTRNDRPELIHDGVIQNAGNMLLNLVMELADDEDLSVRASPSTVVYFDYLGLFLVTYTKDIGLVLDLVVGVVGLIAVIYYTCLFGFRWSTIRVLLWSIVGRLLCVVAGVATVALFTTIMVYTTTQMRYLSEQWIVAPLYWIPYVTASLAASQAFDVWRTSKSGLSRSIRTVQAVSATRLLISLALLTLCCFPALANVRYLITAPLLLMSVASVIIMTMVRYWNLKAWQHLLLEVFLNIPSTMIAFSLATRLNALLIPIMGRSATDYPDVIIAAANTALAIVTCATVSGIELLFSRKRLWMVVCSVLACCVVIMFIPLSPYRGENTTQRHYWFHSQITTYNQKLEPTETISGVLITKLDAHNVESALTAIKRSALYTHDSRKNSSKELRISSANLNLINEECEKYIYCNMPLLRPRFDKLIYNSVFVKMSPPAQFNHSLVLLNRSCSGDECSLSFVMDGPAHNTIIIWPRLNVSLSSWSFESPVRETMTRQGRPVYNIIQSTATHEPTFKPLEFTLNLTVPVSLQSDVMLEMSHHAHKIHHPEEFTDDYKQLLAIMPEYFNIATYLSFRSNYVF